VTRDVYRALHRAITSGFVRSAHDLSEGGLAVAAAEMCIGGRLGMAINTEKSTAFVEVNGCLLVEISPERASAFESELSDLPFKKIGSVTSKPTLRLGDEEVSVDDLVHAFNNPNQA
jgi:phosphoribosylformylglycinamidine (FGAM) synthase-like enzyme